MNKVMQEFLANLIRMYVSSALRAYPATVPFLVCFDFLLFLTSRVLFFISKVINFSIIFEARAVVFEARALILEARGPIWRISGMVVWFYRKKCVRGPPPRCPWTCFLRSREVAFFSSVFVSGFLWFWVPRDSIVGVILIPFWEPWASSKTVESV